MISSLTGVVAGFGPSAIELEVAGVGYLVNVPSPMLATLSIGQRLRVVTHMVVREDSMTLYGFGFAEQRDLFLSLIGVSGVGPRLALAIIAAFEPDAFRRVIVSGDVGALTSVSGIGKRGAERIIVELKERLGAPVEVTGAGPSKLAEVRDALVGLGYAPAELRSVLDHVSQIEGGLQPGDQPENGAGPSKPATVEEMVKAALKELARL